jgi:hypothetical protein
MLSCTISTWSVSAILSVRNSPTDIRPTLQLRQLQQQPRPHRAAATAAATQQLLFALGILTLRGSKHLQ